MAATIYSLTPLGIGVKRRRDLAPLGEGLRRDGDSLTVTSGLSASLRPSQGEFKSRHLRFACRGRRGGRRPKPAKPLPTGRDQSVLGPSGGQEPARRSSTAVPLRSGPRICGQSPARAPGSGRTSTSHASQPGVCSVRGMGICRGGFRLFRRNRRGHDYWAAFLFAFRSGFCRASGLSPSCTRSF
jgi:hypothetical protein